MQTTLYCAGAEFQGEVCRGTLSLAAQLRLSGCYQKAHNAYKHTTPTKHGHQAVPNSIPSLVADIEGLRRETLSLAAQLRLSGTKGSSEDRQQAVEDLIQRLGLSGSADTIVGNAKTRCLTVSCWGLVSVFLGHLAAPTPFWATPNPGAWQCQVAVGCRIPCKDLVVDSIRLQLDLGSGVEGHWSQMVFRPVLLEGWNVGARFVSGKCPKHGSLMSQKCA